MPTTKDMRHATILSMAPACAVQLVLGEVNIPILVFPTALAYVPTSLGMEDRPDIGERAAQIRLGKILPVLNCLSMVPVSNESSSSSKF
jgi:hypothetical protein